MTPGTTLSLTGGAFAYERHAVFHDLSLSLEPGRVAALLGPNGCGKTTLLRCLGGALPLQAGRVTLEGRDLSRFGELERARRIAYVFQEHRTVFPYSVLETVRMGRTPHLGFLGSPGPHDTAIAERALATMGCEHLRAARYTEISGGERQLVLIARALAQEPTILLLDEPTSHLDFGNQMLLLAAVERLARERGLAVLMSTHHPDHALLVAQHVYLMRGGAFLAEGSPRDVITAENMRALYGIDVWVTNAGAQGDRRVVVPVLGPRMDEPYYREDPDR